MGRKDWKRGLLSSGLPLEYEVTKYFRNKNLNCEIRSEFTYNRNYLNEVKEFSIDLMCRFPVKTQRGEGHVDINYLIECKFRTRGKQWLFLPFVGDFADENFSTPISSINSFEPIEFNSMGFTGRFGKKLPQAFKGIEFHTHTNEFIESNFTRGVSQLQYAVPNYVFENMGFYFDLHYDFLKGQDEVTTELICPILLTNAELRVLNPGLSINMVENAESIDAISDKVEFLCYNISPRKEFLNYIQFVKNNSLDKEIERARLINNQLKQDYIEEIFDKIGQEVNFNSIVICNIDAIEDLTSKVEELGRELGIHKGNHKVRYRRHLSNK